MQLARVIGTLVSDHKVTSLQGVKFLILRPLTVEGQDATGYVVAIDAIGAGVDEVVMYATGSSARQTETTNNRPCDAVVMAIVDQWETNGEMRYRKVDATDPWAS